mgnify:CR=1 FL=1
MSDDQEVREIIEHERMMFDEELREGYVSKDELRGWCQELIECYENKVSLPSIAVCGVLTKIIDVFCSEAK